MIDTRDIPDFAICHKCRQPMKVIDLGAQAARLGVKISEGSYVIECCGHELTIDDESTTETVKELLLAYHREAKKSTGGS